MDEQEEKGPHSPEGFPSLHVAKQEICMGLRPLQNKNISNQFKLLLCHT